MTLLAIASVLLGLVVSGLAGFPVRWLAPRCGLVDVPDQRKTHRAATPLGGGLAIALGVLVPVLAGSWALRCWDAEGAPYLLPTVYEALGDNLLSHAVMVLDAHLLELFMNLRDVWLLLAAAGALLLLGLADDLRALDWRLRLAVQAAVAAGLAFGCRWTIPGLGPLAALAGIATVVWVVGLVNSFNMLDNMDGLSAGVAAIAAGFLAAILWLDPPAQAAWPPFVLLALVLFLVGALAGFLWHNRPPARLFMGDAGSYFVGFLVAEASVLAMPADAARPWPARLAPLCLLAVPIYDTLSVVLIRLAAGRSPFAADRCHLSHRLVARGWSPTVAVLLIYLAAAISGAAALVVSRAGAAGGTATLLGLAGATALLAVLDIRARRAGRPQSSPS